MTTGKEQKEEQQTLPNVEPVKRVFLFHSPSITEQPGSVKRVTVAYTLQKTDNSNESEDEWLLSYGATIFTPTREDTVKFRESLNFVSKCENCRNANKSCDECAPKREMYRNFLHRNVWNKTLHIRRARERLANNPLRFVLWSQTDPKMSYYQFRRLEQFILKRIHYFGVDNTETDNTPACPEIITEYAEHGYDIMSENLSKAEFQDRERFLKTVKRSEQVTEQVTVNNPNFTTTLHFLPSQPFTVTVPMPIFYLGFIYFFTQLFYSR